VLLLSSQLKMLTTVSLLFLGSNATLRPPSALGDPMLLKYNLAACHILLFHSAELDSPN